MSLLLLFGTPPAPDAVPDTIAGQSSLDFAYQGQPFAQVMVSNSLPTDPLDMAFMGVPFFGVRPPSAIARRALILAAGLLKEILDAQVGTGLKPIVLVGGGLQERVASEGTPVVVVNGKLKTLAADETLTI